MVLVKPPFFWDRGEPDTLLILASARSGYYYLCDKIEAVDAHIDYCRHETRSKMSALSDLVKTQYRRDIDRLLERRLYLMTIGEVAA